ncbi:MAG TPA: hypothetical protein PKA28_09220 [Methylomusa anaerophila]|uniref:Uncharacterized protein n=1 Tax=Methylomusa anaerophila TaxID=1930071 RepID=A0A348AKQ1_9FIRM|nr:hypothetical protein [Methylomusa anaerophila]BBB91649.1 hypothetical protein MAMMFC1_02333 [Methylomusa anaerophila]HML88617.1 hypothetical protein [Methylomusa anaerophila]
MKKWKTSIPVWLAGMAALVLYLLTIVDHYAPSPYDPFLKNIVWGIRDLAASFFIFTAYEIWKDKNEK